MANDALKLSGMSKAFDGVPALSNVSLDVSAASVHGLIGQNGAGKSTLIKVLAGLHRADSGQIFIDGVAQTVAAPAHARRLGIEIVHQDRLLGATQTVAEVLALGDESTLFDFARLPFVPGARQLALLNPWRMRRAARDAIQHHFGIDIDPGRLIGTLSVAEQQVVQITRALSRSPRVLVFDEPTAALSAHEAQRLFRAIQKLRAQGLAILYVSHYLDEIHALCDQVTVLRDGVNVASFTVADSRPEQWLQAMIGDVRPADTTHTGAVVHAAHEADEAHKVRHALVDDEADSPARSAASAIALEAEPAKSIATPGSVELQSLAVPGRFHDISLTIRPGEIVGITGLLGAGGKEVVRSLFGLESGVTGTLQVNGRPFRPTSPRAAVAHGIAFVPEDRRAHGIALDLPLRDNMTLATIRRFFRFGRIDTRRERTRVQQQIDALHIVTPGSEALARQLSGGNQQKAVLAKWLDTHASLYLIDEPTVGIDIGAKQEVYRLLHRLAANGAAILLYSTDLIELLGQTDRIVVMARGRIVRHVASTETDAHDLLAWASGAHTVQRADESFSDVPEHIDHDAPIPTA